MRTVSCRRWVWVTVVALCCMASDARHVRGETERLILPESVVGKAAVPAKMFDLVVLGNEQIKRPLIGAAPEFIAKPQGGSADFRVKGQQVGIRIEEPVFVTPATTVSWFWRKEQGHVCIVQIRADQPGDQPAAVLRLRRGRAERGAFGRSDRRDLRRGRPAGAGGEGGAQPVRRHEAGARLGAGPDRQRLSLAVGRRAGRVCRHGHSRRDRSRTGRAGLSAAVDESARASTSRRSCRITRPSTSSGSTPASRSARRAATAAPTNGARSAPSATAISTAWAARCTCATRSTTWSSASIDGGKEIMPDSLDSFRLGLVNNRLPAIWGGWRHGELLYKVSVMTVPDETNGNFDLYKLEIQNPTDQAAAEQAGRGARRPAGHAARGRRRPRPGRRAVPDRGSAGQADAQAPRLGPVRQAGEGLCHRAGAGHDRAGRRAATASGSTACRSSIASRPRPARSTSSTWSRRRTSAGYLAGEPEEGRRSGLRVPRRRRRAADARLHRVHAEEEPAAVRPLRRCRGHGRRRLHRGSVGRGRRTRGSGTRG